MVGGLVILDYHLRIIPNASQGTSGDMDGIRQSLKGIEGSGAVLSHT